MLFCGSSHTIEIPKLFLVHAQRFLAHDQQTEWGVHGLDWSPASFQNEQSVTFSYSLLCLVTVGCCEASRDAISIWFWYSRFLLYLSKLFMRRLIHADSYKHFLCSECNFVCLWFGVLSAAYHVFRLKQPRTLRSGRCITSWATSIPWMFIWSQQKCGVFLKLPL